MTESRNNSSTQDDNTRFTLWKILGAAIVVLALAIIVAAFSIYNSYKSESIKKAQEIAAANRPVDAVNVSLLDLKKTKVVDSITLPGFLQAWDKAQLSAQVSGKLIKKVPEGTKVKEGDPIAYLDQSDYQIKLTEAESTYLEAKQNYERKQKLRSSRINALSELEQATATYNKAKSEYEAAKLSLERCIIHAPFDGVVDTVPPEIGELVSIGQDVATVAQLGELKVEVGIPEKDIDMVRSVKECAVNVEAAKSKTTGERTYLSYLPSETSQVYTLRLKIPNKEEKMRPGMFSDVKVIREIRTNFLVPIYSVMAKDDQHYVFVSDNYKAEKKIKNDQRNLMTARKRLVKLGVIQGTNVEILSGLKEGDQIVVVGQRNLDDGTIMSIVKKFGELSEFSQ